MDVVASTVEPLVTLNCVEYRQEVIGGLSVPRLVVATHPSGGTLQLVMKLRWPQGAGTIERGHFGPTSLACEFICSVLARWLGVRVPECFAVHVTEEFAASVPDDAAGRLLLDNVGLNFGTVYLDNHPMWDPGLRPDDTELVSALEDVVVFDGAVFNADRIPAKPNLMFGSAGLVAIDHSLALFVHQMSEPVSPAEQLPDAYHARHCAGQAVRDRGLFFQEVVNRWTMSPSLWDELRECIPAEWETRPGDLDRVFSFLEARDLATLPEQLRGVFR